MTIVLHTDRIAELLASHCRYSKEWLKVAASAKWPYLQEPLPENQSGKFLIPFYKETCTLTQLSDRIKAGYMLYPFCRTANIFSSS